MPCIFMEEAGRGPVAGRCPVTNRAHHHQENHPELSTLESVAAFMGDQEEARNEHPEPTPNFRHYLEAQRHLKSRRVPNRHQPVHTDVEHHAPPAAAAAAVNNRRRESSKHPSRNRLVALQAMSAMGLVDSAHSQSAFNEVRDYELSPERESARSSSKNSGRDRFVQTISDMGLLNSTHVESIDQEHHSHALKIPLYCPPVQRQRWDDDQILPHVNWGDLFFDLFYVAAAYNLGGMLMSASNAADWPRGVVYFIGIFGPLYNIWEHDVVYSSRYALVDYAHRLVSIMRFFCVSFAVLSIKSIKSLSDNGSVDTFCLTLSLFCESAMQLGLNIELYFLADGDRKAIKNHTQKKIMYQFLPTTLTYLVAAIISGVSFFETFVQTHDRSLHHDDGSTQSSNSAYHTNSTDADHHNHSTYSPNSVDLNTILYAAETGDVAEILHATHDVAADNHHFRALGEAVVASSSGCSSHGGNGGHRFLAGTEIGCDYPEGEGFHWSIADVPLALCFGIYVFNIIFTLCRKYPIPGRTEGDFRDNFVPNNIDYMIHRYGEWVMLMIGESILSLLIVETVESMEYYTITALGCITVIVLQMLKFESEPSHADGHALWRSRTAAALFSLLIQVLSMGLIAFGVSFKIMLTTVYKAESAAASDGHRRLASVPVIDDEASAALFCGSLFIVLLSLEFMLGTHRGVANSCGALFHDLGTFHSKSVNWPFLFIGILKVFIILFTGTVSQWTTDPVQLTIYGFLVVAAMAFIRIISWGFDHHEKEIYGAINFISKSVCKAAASIARSEAESIGSDDKLEMEKALWDTSFDAIVVTDRTGVIKHVNTVALSQFGYDSEKELIGNNVTLLVGGDDAKHHHIYMDRFNKNESTSTIIGKQRKLKARRKDGTEFHCIIGIKEIPTTDLLVGYIRESVTEEKAMHLSSTETEVDETSFDSIIVIDPLGKILNVNLTTVGEFGYTSKGDLIGNNISILVGGDEAEKHDSYLAKFEEGKGEDSTIGNQRVLYAKRKDGSEFPCVIGIKRCPDGKNLKGYIRNMSGVSTEEDNLREKMKYLVDDTSFDSIVVIDTAGIILQVNLTAVEDFGYNAKAELIGKNISILVGGGHAKKHSQYLRKFKKKSKGDSAIGKQRTLRARRKDGTEFTCVIGIKTIPDTELLIGYIRSTEGLSKTQKSEEFDAMSKFSTGNSVIHSNAGSILPSNAGSLHDGSIASEIDNSQAAGDQQGILDESFDAVVVADFQGKILKVNQTVLDTFRYDSKDDLVGQNIRILVGGGEAAAHDGYLENFHKEGKSSSQIGKQRVLYSRRKDGSEFPCIVGIKTTPKKDGLVGWIRDMSDFTALHSSVEITGMDLLGGKD